MNKDSFVLSLKSTIDFQAKTLADSLGLPFLDLASVFNENDLMESDQPVVCWEFTSIGEFPVDPMWYAEFEIGVMTMLDPSQYISLDVVGKIASHFSPNTSLPIFDYSGDVVSNELGRMLVASSGVTPQQSDRATGIRFVTVNVRATRKV